MNYHTLTLTHKISNGSDRVLGSFISLVLGTNEGNPCPALVSSAVKEALGPCVKKEGVYVGKKERARQAAAATAALNNLNRD